jgi:hypothetical protein
MQYQAQLDILIGSIYTVGMSSNSCAYASIGLYVEALGSILAAALFYYISITTLGLFLSLNQTKMSSSLNNTYRLCQGNPLT